MHLAETNYKELFLYGGYYGIFIVMCLYNFFLFLSLRNTVYLYYIFYVTGFGLLQLSMNGFAFQYLWPASINFNSYSIFIFIILAQSAVLIFSKEFLDTKNNSIIANKLILILLSIYAIIFISGLSFLKYSLALKLALANVLFVSITLIVSGIIIFKKGYTPARFYLLAWSFFLIGILIFVLRIFNIFPESFLSTNGMQIGSVLEVVLFSFAIADRINLLKKEKEIAQQKSLEAMEETARIKEAYLQAYSRFVPLEFLNLLGKESILHVSLGDQVLKDMSILFSDIRQFTNLSENMTPEENFNFLNSYLKRVGPIIRNQHGFIDKYIGDAIMALFPRSVDDAIQSAIEIQKELVHYNQHRSNSGYAEVKVGIGIHIGALMLGTIGENQRMEGTVISDAVNLASRLEGLTKIYGTKILVSEAVIQKLKEPQNFHYRFLDEVKVKGKEKPVKIAEILDCYEEDIFTLFLQTKNNFDKALQLYKEENFSEAIHLFEKIIQQNPEDSISKAFLQICLEKKELKKHSPKEEQGRGRYLQKE